MLIMGMIGLGVYFADPAPSRSFPILFRDGEVVYPQFAYPLRKEIIPIWAAAMLAFFVPFIVFLIVQIRARSFWDLNNAVSYFFFSCHPLMISSRQLDCSILSSVPPSSRFS